MAKVCFGTTAAPMGVVFCVTGGLVVCVCGFGLGFRSGVRSGRVGAWSGERLLCLLLKHLVALSANVHKVERTGV